MADYQSLLTRAVANLPNANSPESRQAIYERARKALLSQLRTLRPPLPENDIAREASSLDSAIMVVEAKFAQGEAPQNGAAPATAAQAGTLAGRQPPAPRPEPKPAPDGAPPTAGPPDRTAPEGPSPGREAALKAIRPGARWRC